MVVQQVVAPLVDEPQTSFQPPSLPLISCLVPLEARKHQDEVEEAEIVVAIPEVADDGEKIDADIVEVVVVAILIRTLQLDLENEYWGEQNEMEVKVETAGAEESNGSAEVE